ncbi:DUF3459 domain-containing protein, partial [Streptomyces sp. URMC 129]|uniref:DUF3459 domain-containing protein n=1 Tax=Streptomyces sp. URMC 129 TaxID=3423407 RepID=UPI003F1B028F
ERLAALVGPERAALAAALVLCGPFTPMLFMGEEWGATTPWQYFTDHRDPELAEAVRAGRRREFAAHGWSAEEIPDPQDPATRDRSCLDWPADPARERLWDWHRRLLAIRHAHLPPGLRLGEVTADHDEAAGWLVVNSGPVTVAVNFSPTATAAATLPPGLFETLAATHRCPPP